MLLSTTSFLSVLSSSFAALSISSTMLYLLDAETGAPYCSVNCMLVGWGGVGMPDAIDRRYSLCCVWMLLFDGISFRVAFDVRYPQLFNNHSWPNTNLYCNLGKEDVHSSLSDIFTFWIQSPSFFQNPSSIVNLVVVGLTCRTREGIHTPLSLSSFMIGPRRILSDMRAVD